MRMAIRFLILPLRKNPFTGIRTSVSSNCTDRFPRPAFYMAETLAKAIALGWNNYPVKAIPCLLRAGKKMSCHWQRMVSMRFASIAKRLLSRRTSFINLHSGLNISYCFTIWMLPEWKAQKSMRNNSVNTV